MRNQTKIIFSVLISLALAAWHNSPASIIPTPPMPANDTLANNDIYLSGVYSVYMVPSTLKGTANNWIYIDGQNKTTINGCLKIYGQYIVVQNLIVTGCTSHAVLVDNVTSDPLSGQYVWVQNVTVYHNGTVGATNWPSALKCEQGASYVVFANNTVYENYGEGTAFTMCAYGWALNNNYRDNWSVSGVYADNSDHIYVSGNYVTNTGMTGYTRNGKNYCFLVGAEDYTKYGWTNNHLATIYIQSNWLDNCKPISFWNPLGIASNDVQILDNISSGVTLPISSVGTVIANVTGTPAARTSTPVGATVTPTRPPATSTIPPLTSTPAPVPTVCEFSAHYMICTK